MFERFTERARQVVVLAQDEARHFGHTYIGTEHLVLGLLREEEGLAARVLTGFDLSVDGVRSYIQRVVGHGEGTTVGQIPFTPRAKKVLDLALRDALSLGHNYIGTEHILLGLVRENEGVGSRILLDFGTDAEKIRNEIIRVLSGPRGVASKVTPLVTVPIEVGSTPERLVVRIGADPADSRANGTLLLNAAAFVKENGGGTIELGSGLFELSRTLEIGENVVVRSERAA
jgi:hypothetical protein